MRRASSIGGSCGQAVCFNEAKRGRPCGNDHRACDSRPGANDGICDACTLVGGVTTEDEMFISALGRWYLQPPAP